MKQEQEKKRTRFYFDTAKYTLRLRQYHALLNFANDVLREIKKCGVYPTNELLRGLMQTRQERAELIAQKTQGESVKMRNMYALKLDTTQGAKDAWAQFVENNLSVQAKPLHRTLKRQFDKAFEELLQACYNIREKYVGGGRGAIFDDIDFNCIEYNEESKDVILSKETIQAEKERCFVYAESERAESVFNGLLEVAEKLNDIMPNLLHPTQILSAFDFDTTTGKIEVVKNYDFNTL